MSLEIREPRDDELDEVAYIGAYSFHGDRSPEALEHRRSLYTVLRPLVAFQHGRVVASLTLLPLSMAVNDGLVLQWQTQPDKVDPEKFLGPMADMITRYLTAENQESSGARSKRKSGR
jgi:hypothetical protein